MSITSFAQKMTITDVKTKGNQITVFYDLSMDNAIWCKLGLFLSVDGGKTFYQEPLKAVSGDVGMFNSGGKKSITWNAKEEKNLLKGEDLVFRVMVLDAKLKRVVESRFIVQAIVGVNPSNISKFSVSDLSYGLMVGWSKKLGAYIKFRSNFNFQSTSLSGLSTGELSDKGYFWTNGKSKSPFMLGTVGALFNISKMVYINMGVGYGSRILAWQSVDNSTWIKISDYSHTGIAADLGVLLRFGMVSVSAGASAIINNGVYFQPEIGVGIIF